MAIRDRSLIFKVPPLDPRLKSYFLTVIVQDFNKEKLVDPDVIKEKKVSDHLCHNFGDTWIAKTKEITENYTQNITIGSGNGKNKYLEANTKYCVTFIVTNKYKNAEHDVVYYEKLETPDGPSSSTADTAQNNHLFLLLLLLLLIPISFCIYR